jgi:serine/threonine protein phosphatase 1
VPIRLFRSRPSRVPTVPPGQRIYAIGDVHGRSDLHDRLMAMVRDDRAAAPPGTAATVVLLGDLVDRGPDSAGMLERLAAGPPSGFGLVALRGNHEDTMERFLDDPGAAPEWFRFGGLATLESYGVRLDPRLPGPARVTAAHAALRAALPHRHLAVLRAMRSHLFVGDYLLVHAGVRPGVPLDAQDPADLMWIREDFLDSGADHGKVVVHGHTIVRAPEVRRNRIGIDTGAFATGRLTALVLEGEDRRFLST